jgi:predicted transcriptional regulator
MTEIQTAPILVSFKAKWEAHFRDQSLGAFVRTRAPIARKTNKVYVHINSPVSSVVARASITRLERVAKNEILAQHRQLKIKPQELAHYLSTASEAWLYEIGSIEFAQQSARSSEIRGRATYHPPQSFMFVGPELERAICEICGFPE